MAERFFIVALIILVAGCSHREKSQKPAPVATGEQRPASAADGAPAQQQPDKDSGSPQRPTPGGGSKPVKNGETGSTPDPIVGQIYRQRYRLPDAGTKLIDNHGDGEERLYGLRNVRAVFAGVYYRGGANNYYNKHKHRSNMNPLPNEGLQHLCEEGFGQAVYLYHLRYQTAPHSIRCRTFDGAENTLQYDQISPLDYNADDLGRLHIMIQEHIRNPRLGPIYLHCWNGWHASGFVAATALMQFCGFSAEQAVNYWNRNTDGYDGRSFNGVRAKIRNFVPKPGMELTGDERKALCPQTADLRFQ